MVEERVELRLRELDRQSQGRLDGQLLRAPASTLAGSTAVPPSAMMNCNTKGKGGAANSRELRDHGGREETPAFRPSTRTHIKSLSPSSMLCRQHYVQLFESLGSL